MQDIHRVWQNKIHHTLFNGDFHFTVNLMDGLDLTYNLSESYLLSEFVQNLPEAYLVGTISGPGKTGTSN